MNILLLKHDTGGQQPPERHQESFEQARVTAVRRRPVPGRGDMRRRPATQAPAATAQPGARREVTIAVVRAAEPQASLEENLALFTAALAGPAGVRHLVRMHLMPHAARIAELAGPRRCLTADGEVAR